MLDHVAIVASTAGPAFAVDAKGRVCAWNAAAEELLGYASSEVIGRECWDVLAGRDRHGNDYCGVHCPLLDMAQQRKPIHPSELFFRTKAGPEIHVCVVSFAVPNSQPSELAVVHVLCAPAAAAAPRNRSADHDGANRIHECVALTAREEEVLRLLARGFSTTDTARELGVSAATVRNHVAKTMRKLRVHSRLQAVSEARRLGMLE